MKSLSQVFLLIILLAAAPLWAQPTRAQEREMQRAEASALGDDGKQMPRALQRKLLGVREQRPHDDPAAAQLEGRTPFLAAERSQRDEPTSPSPRFPGALSSSSGAFGDVQQEWVQHYGSGLAPSYDEATALVVDGSGNVYIAGFTSGRPLGLDYFTVKNSPAGAELWRAAYDGPDHGEDYAMAIAVDAGGNVYVTGYSWGANSSYDYATVKYNSAGVQQWTQRYDGPDNSGDAAYALGVDGAGNVYVTGESFSTSTYSDWATIKYNSSGAQQWVQRYDGTGNYNDHAYDLAIDGAGNVYVTGRSYGSGSYYDYATLKYGNDGTQQWVQRYDGSGNDYDYALDLALDASGNVYITGYTYSSATRYDYATLKYNNAGVQQWVQTYNGPGNDYDIATVVAVDASGNVFVTGYSTGSGSRYDFATIKYDNAGAQQWVQRNNGSGNDYDYGLGLDLDASGNVYVAGYSYVPGASYDYVAIKYNNAGTQQWLQSYNGPANGSDYAAWKAFDVDASGNVHLAGFSYGGNNNGYDCATVKWNSAGVKQWEARYLGPGGSLDFAAAIAADTAGNVYVTGSSYAVGTGYDYLTLKYSDTGSLLWHQRYNSSGSATNEPFDLAVDLAGNVYVTGTHGTIKYNGAGVQQWLATGSATALTVDGAGNVFVISSVFRSGTGTDYRLAKYNSAGVLQWTVHYSGPGNASDFATALVLDTAGNVYVTGYSHGGSLYYDYATIKFDNAGVQQWTQRYNYAAADSNDRAYAIAVDAAGNVYVAGESYSGSTSYDYATIKYNNAGVQQWVQRTTTLGAYTDRATDVAVDAAGNVFAAGFSGTIKYSPSGVPLWIAGDGAYDLALDRAGNAYVTASQYNARSGYDIFTIRYNGSTGTEEWRQTYGAPGDGTDEPAESTALALDAADNVIVAGSSDGDNWTVYTTIKYAQSFPPSPALASIKPQASSPQLPGAEFWVDIVIDSVQNLFGVSCDLSYTNTAFIDVVIPHSSNVVAGPFLGNDVVFFSNVDETAGKVSLGISRKAGQSGVSGSGVVARVKFISLASTPLNTPVVFSFANATGIDASGNAIVLTPATLNVTIGGAVVWPGDTNNDGKVDAADVLPIGLYWAQTGATRQNGSCTWAGQPATPWSPVQATYADANGDGSVDAADVLCIGLNWGNTHSVNSLLVASTKYPVLAKNANAAALCYTLSGNPFPGQDFWVEVHADEVANLFGLSFDLTYAPAAFVNPQITEAGSFMGSDIVFFANSDTSAGVVSVGATRKAGQGGVSGSGLVAKIKMRVSSQIPAGQQVTFTLQNCTAIDAAGNAVILTPLGACVISGVNGRDHAAGLPSTFALHPNHPNPFNPETTIGYDLPQAVEVKLEIFDVLGQSVRTLVNQRQHAGRYAITWDGRNARGEQLATGMFIYRLQAGSFAQSRKMVLAR